MTSSPTCCGGCVDKDKQIAYLKAVIALDSLPGTTKIASVEGEHAMNQVEVLQQMRFSLC